MLLRALWILGLGFALLGEPAQASPCDGSCGKKNDHDSCGKKDDCDAFSIQLKLAKHGDRSHHVARLRIGNLPSGLSKLSKQDDFPALPPGFSKRDGLAALQPGLAMPDNPAQAIPEPTGLVLFGLGLLVARAARRG